MRIVAGVAMTVLVLLGACADRPAAPVVRLVMHDAEALPVYVRGAEAWGPLGFDVSFDDSGMPECDPHWYETGETDCQRSLFVVRFPQLVEKYGAEALADFESQSIVIDARITDETKLELASAHEAGHLLLNFPGHTAGGIMGGSSLTMTDADRALACSQIHICL